MNLAFRRAKVQSMLTTPTEDCRLLTLLGATATGKTRVGVALAEALQGEIISADSRQVFRGMDLGTGKDLHEYRSIPYHLIDICAAGEEFSVFAFQRLFLQRWDEIGQRRKLPLLVGGTGLYLDAVLKGYRLVEVPENPELRAELDLLSDEQLTGRLLALQPEQHNQTDLQQRQRLIRAIEIASGEAAAGADLPPWPELSPLVFGLKWERSELRQRIRLRLKQRLEEGMLDEVRTLHDAGVSWERLDYYGLEYRFVARHLRGELNRNDMTQQLAGAIAQFAKRQETWFRRMERQGIPIHWVNGKDRPAEQILNRLKEGGWQVDGPSLKRSR